MSRSKFGHARWAVAKLWGAALYSACVVSTPAAAQSVSALDEIVVTGTSIRGAAPVGANLISLERDEIARTGAQTVQQVLANVPQVTGFNNIAQGSFGSADASGTHAPTIHSLGASASNGTLILINGRRLPLSGLNHTLADPNIIAPAALARVEILPDGASAVYGSDAVAGVLNFITRRRYEGVEASAQLGFGDAYRTSNLNLVSGGVWSRGSALLAYGYSHRSNLKGADRAFVRTDLRALGGQNFGSFNCSPAAVQPAAGQPGAGQRFLYPYEGSGGLATFVNPCDWRQYATRYDIVPEETRHSLLASFEHNLTDRLTASADLVWSRRLTETHGSRGSLSAITVYGPGSTPPGGAGQINPFFRGPPGVVQEMVFFNFDQLLGPGQVSEGGAESAFGTFSLAYDAGGGWIADLAGTFGRDDSSLRDRGRICQPCALLALNGSTQASGNPSPAALPPGLPPGAVITQFPLTPANALDVWSPVGQNRTSAEVLQRLLDSDLNQDSRHTLASVKATLSGPLFELPAGTVRTSVGAEGLRYTLIQSNTRPNTIGPASADPTLLRFEYERNVHAVFGEIVVPVIGGAGASPYLRRLDLSAAVRHDNYSDFGSTTNPRLAFTLQPVEDLTFRGSYGTSFTAPALTSRGDARGVTSGSTYGASGQQSVPASFPGVTALPGCNPIPAAGCLIGGSNPAQGLIISGGNKDLQPSVGKTYSLGVDVRPRFLPGLSASVTWWRARYDGLITAPTFTAVTTNPSLYEAFIINPTPAQIEAATRHLQPISAIPTNISFIHSFQQRNAFDLDASGVDVDIRYRATTPRWGVWTFGVAFSDKLSFDQRTSAATPWVDNLNVAGVNTTFSSLKFNGRASLGWTHGGWDAAVFANHTKAYWARTANNLALHGPQGQRVSAYTTFDANLMYDFAARGGPLDRVQLYLNARNIFDRPPPFVNIPGGYNELESNPIGRLVTFGVRKAW